MKNIRFQNFYVVLILTVLPAGCYQPKTTNTDVLGYPVVIDIKEAVRNAIEYKLSDVIDSISYIPLESFIGDYVTSVNPNMIKISQNYIVAENYFGGTEVLCFDRTGKFTSVIARRGRGPGEYNRLDDVAIDEKNGIVYVLSRNERKIFKYSFEGNFSGSLDLFRPADRIIVSPAGQLLVHFLNWTGDLQYSCFLLNNDGHIVNMLENNIFYRLSAEKRLMMFAYESVCYIYNNQIHIKDKCDTLYVVENDRFIPKYIFNDGIKNSNNMTQSEYDEKMSIHYFYETNNHVLFNFRFNEKWYNAYYDKTVGKTFASSTRIINDLDDTDFFSFNSSFYQFNNIIIKEKYAVFDREKLQEKVSPSRYLKIANMLDSLDDEYAIIIEILHLKQ